MGSTRRDLSHLHRLKMAELILHAAIEGGVHVAELPNLQQLA